MKIIEKCHHQFFWKSSGSKLSWYGGLSCTIQSCGV